MDRAKVDARPFEMLYIDPLIQLKGGAFITRKNGEKLGQVPPQVLTDANPVNLETLTPVVKTTPRGIDMENAKLEDVTSLSVVYAETQPSKIGAAFDSLWESNRLINECLEGLRNDKLEREKQQKKEKEAAEKQQKKEAEEREKQQKEQEARFLAMEKRFAGVAVLETTVAALETTVAALEKKYDKDTKYLKDEIAARDFKIEALETKVESQAAKILGLEAEVRTLNQARHDDQEAYRVLIARIQPLFLIVPINLPDREAVEVGQCRRGIGQFLLKGGFLGFGLSHSYYPMDYKTDTLSEIQKHLRGPNLVLKDVCNLLVLLVLLKMLYNGYDESTACLLDHFVKFDDIDAYNIDGDVIHWLVKHDKGEMVYDPSDKDFDVNNGKHSPVVWIC
ncbi:unnamed protein product [Cyclocybe aegerita]|uniref:Uncharacterized protein n=1 Tax=Cyclocybe aegerita TaxID=1973307 RepID=A0A8S0W0J0_CYCAE|nr:unnamed protein product [Cyclocybe aegerita]